MKSRYLVAAGLCCLGGCNPDDSFSPRIDAAFNQSMTLRHRQRAALPTQRAPELTVGVDTLEESRCPRNINCVQGGTARVVLGIQDQGGATQSLALKLMGLSTTIDSAVVPANGRRYVVVLHEVTPYPNTTTIANDQRRVVLTVKRR